MEELFMQRCLDLAVMGKARVAPNPMVGCVIVHNGKIIGEGFHRQFGALHAEAKAIESTEDKALLRQATLYVNLEPCTHVGKTPACADSILNSGIPKVVIGCTDSNKEIRGGGESYLRENGCEVMTGVSETACRTLNKRFFTFHEKKRPYIVLKWAISKDGYMAGKDKKPHWITCKESRRLVHKWRTEEQAILVGANTVIADNPLLTARLWKGRHPLRIAIDRRGRIPSGANLLNGEVDALVFSGVKAGKEAGVTYLPSGTGADQLNQIMAELHNREIASVMVEGGVQLLGSLIGQGLWDEARVFTGAEEMGEGLEAPEPGVTSTEQVEIGADLLQVYHNPT